MDDVTVEQWRLEQLERMDFTLPSATLLNEWNVDLHEAQDLISSGCPHDVAMRILRPLEDHTPHSAEVVERIEEYSIKAA